MNKKEILKRINTIMEWINEGVVYIGTPQFNHEALEGLIKELKELHFKLYEINLSTFKKEGK